MKIQILSGIAVTMVALGTAHAALYPETFTVGTAIPDGNPVGISFSGNVSDIPGGSTVSGLSVTLNISGGYNGDLYSYLVAPNGTMVVLLNQPGVTSGNPFGFAGSGMNLTLSDSGTDGSIQTATETAGVVLTGSFTAAGSLASFNGSGADGTWTLYFADESSGGGTSILNSWSLGITTVPEPVNVVLGFFGGLVLAGAALRRARSRSV